MKLILKTERTIALLKHGNRTVEHFPGPAVGACSAVSADPMGEVAPAALGGVDDEGVSLINQEVPLLSPQDVLGHNHIGVKVVWGSIQ